jgi:rhodanese-related sulfurtransferase
MTMNEIRRTTKMRNLALLLLIVFCQNAMAAESSVDVSPPIVTASVGDTFTIDIIVDSADNAVYGAQYELYFDNTLLNATSQTQGTFLSRDGGSTNVPIDEINNTLGKIVYGEARMGAPAGVTDKGALASITFTAIKSGTSALTLSYVMLMDPTGEIATTINSGTCTVTEPGETPPTMPDYTDISIEEANNMIESNPEVILLDVSARDEYDAEHITDAIWMQIFNASAINELNEYKDWNLIVYSADGTESREACSVLVEHGFENVYNMVGGIAAWRVSFPVFSAPKPTATEPPASSPSPTPTMITSSHPTQAPSSEDNKLPGFEVLFAITGMFAALILKRNNERR